MVRKGFSLVELLVILAVLAILFSLLQPTIRKTLEYSNQIKCMTNLKSHGVALSVYKSDYDQEFPTLGSWISLSGIRGTSTAYGSHVWTAEMRVLNPYLNFDGEVSTCPSDIGDSHPSFNGRIESCSESFGTSYLPAAYGNWSRTRWVFHREKSLKIYEISHLSNKLVLADWPWHWNRPVEDPKTRWHGGVLSRKLNMLFADNHVNLTDFTLDFENTPLKAPDPNWIWW